MWQALYDKYSDRNFIVIAVALDNDIEAARPWIEEIDPTYPVLIDREHRVAELYNMVNVPQAVWIDEQGRMVRPAENAGAYEGFRAMDLQTWTMPDDIGATVSQAKATYVAAIGNWVEKGGDSQYAFDATAARTHIRPPSADIAQAHVLFRLGLYLRQSGNIEEGSARLSEASRLHPESWTIWRQAAETLENGLAAGPDFWTRVQALGNKHFYQPVDMEDMPTSLPPLP